MSKEIKVTIASLEAVYATSLDKFDASLAVSIKDKVAEYIKRNPDCSKTRANSAIRAEHSDLHAKVLASMAKLVDAKKAYVFFKRYKYSMHASFKSRAAIDHKLATPPRGAKPTKPTTKKKVIRNQSTKKS